MEAKLLILGSAFPLAVVRTWGWVHYLNDAIKDWLWTFKRECIFNVVQKNKHYLHSCVMACSSGPQGRGTPQRGGNEILEVSIIICNFKISQIKKNPFMFGRWRFSRKEKFIILSEEGVYYAIKIEFLNQPSWIVASNCSPWQRVMCYTSLALLSVLMIRLPETIIAKSH